MTKGGPVDPTVFAWKSPTNAAPRTALRNVTPGWRCGPMMAPTDAATMMTAVMPQ